MVPHCNLADEAWDAYALLPAIPSNLGAGNSRQTGGSLSKNYLAGPAQEQDAQGAKA